MDIQRIIATGVADIHPVYGGVRGRTMSSHLNYHAWPEVIASGIKTVIDLREGDKSERFRKFCEANGIRYFHYPVDNHCGTIANMVEKFDEFCKVIDEGNFYISCAQGLHRTDIALMTYWVFYGADKGMDAPAVIGYHRDKGKNTEKIMRVLNAIYKYMTEKDGVEPLSPQTFIDRKNKIKEMSKS